MAGARGVSPRYGGQGCARERPCCAHVVMCKAGSVTRLQITEVTSAHVCPSAHADAKAAGAHRSAGWPVRVSHATTVPSAEEDSSSEGLLEAQNEMSVIVPVWPRNSPTSESWGPVGW